MREIVSNFVAFLENLNFTVIKSNSLNWPWLHSIIPFYQSFMTTLSSRWFSILAIGLTQWILQTPFCKHHLVLNQDDNRGGGVEWFVIQKISDTPAVSKQTKVDHSPIAQWQFFLNRDVSINNFGSLQTKMVELKQIYLLWKLWIKKSTIVSLLFG